MCIRDSAGKANGAYSSIGLKSYSGDGVSTISGTGRLLCMGLTGITVDVYKRQVYCIVGKSGAGKTSLLSRVAGLDTCTEGTSLYEGEDLSRLDRDDYRAKKIGVVFQGYNLLLNCLLYTSRCV